MGRLHLPNQHAKETGTLEPPTFTRASPKSPALGAPREKAQDSAECLMDTATAASLKPKCRTVASMQLSNPAQGEVGKPHFLDLSKLSGHALKGCLGFWFSCEHLAM